MKLPVGARLPHDFSDVPPNDPEVVQRNRALYRVTQVLSETPWSSLYRGKKVFRNFEFSKGTLSEASDEECLDVLIRTIAYPRLGNKEDVLRRRDHSRFEAREVLGFRRTNLIAEPLDYFVVRNDQDQFAFPRPGKLPVSEPILIFESFQGDNLARWRQSNRASVPGAMQLVARMASFISTMHAGSFLINSISPASFWVDDLLRIQFIGTETVVSEKQAAAWRDLFPPERHAQGFVAPELLQQQAPDRRSDLFGLAALSYFLICGESPSQIAAHQRQRWARFEAPQRDRLRRELMSLSPNQVGEVKRSLEIKGSRFESLWPDSFLDGLWSCLDPNPLRRPASIDELRSWWGNPPPPSVPVCLAILQPNSTTRVLFSTEGLPTGLQFRVSQAFSPLGHDSHHARDVVWSGMARDRVEFRTPDQVNELIRTASPIKSVSSCWHLSIVSVESNGSVSKPTDAILIDGRTSSFPREFAETLSTRSERLPIEIRLLADLTTPDAIALELMTSKEPRVRCWGIGLLERELSDMSLSARCRVRIEQLGLTDDDYDVRQRAAEALIRSRAEVDVAFAGDIARKIGGTAVDEMIRAARSFIAYGVSPEVVEATVNSLEQQYRIVVCPACQEEMRARELDPHLRDTHRYVDVEGRLLPFGPALLRLWSRVLGRFDETSLADLTSHLTARQAERAESAFSSALSQQVLLALKGRLAAFSDHEIDSWCVDLARCLRSDNLARSACWTLTGHDDSRVRHLVREVLVYDACVPLMNVFVTPIEFHRIVDRLAPAAMASTNERVETCRRLIELGADAGAGDACLQQLELERMVDCPECGTAFSRKDLARHRRGEHHVYEWEGHRCSANELLQMLLERVVAVEPDPYAARCLEELIVEQSQEGISTLSKRIWVAGSDQREGPVTEDSGPSLRSDPATQDDLNYVRENAEQRLFELMRRQWLIAIHDHDPVELATGFGASVGSLGLPLVCRFLRDDVASCRAAGLGMVIHLEAQPPGDILHDAADLLLDISIPDALCQQLVIHWLRRSEIEPRLAARALRSLAARATDKLEGINRLHALEEWVGKSRAIDGVCQELATQIRMRCPRCDELHSFIDMEDHVRRAHGLVLEGRTVRKPWPVVLDCLDEYAENPKSQLLERAEQLADMVSSSDGRMRLWRETLRRGIAPAHYRLGLIRHIATTTDSLCPECWNNIPTGDEPLDQVTITASGHVVSDLISVRRVTQHGVWAGVDISPWDGEPPPWTLTRAGAIGAVAITFGFPSLVCALLAGMGHGVVLPLATTGLLAGSFVAVNVGLFYRPKHLDPVDVMWTTVVPDLLDQQEPFGAEHSAFIASLARASHGYGNPEQRRPILDRVVTKLERHLATGATPARHLAEVIRLQLVDSLVRSDGSKVLLRQLLLTLRGDRSIGFLDLVTREANELLPYHQLDFYSTAAIPILQKEARDVGLTNQELEKLRTLSPTFRFLLRNASNHHGLRHLGDNPELMKKIIGPSVTQCPHCHTRLRLRSGHLAERDRVPTTSSQP